MRTTLGISLLLLCGCGSNSTEFWLAKVKDPSSAERLHAIHALKDRTAEASTIVPALVESLRDSDAFVRRDAAHALAEFGSDARSAVPALLALQKDHEPVRRAAAEALRRIDPDAAERFKKPLRKK